MLTTKKEQTPTGTEEETRDFDDIYDQYFPFVWRCLRGFGVRSEALDDAAQDVFLVVHRRLPTFRGQSTVRTWLFGVARNVASNHLRGARRERAALDPLVGAPENHDSGPLGHAQDAEAAAFLETFLASLDGKKRELFMLAVIEEMSVPEVAAALAIPINTAYTRLRRVRAHFNEALGRKRRST